MVLTEVEGRAAQIALTVGEGETVEGATQQALQALGLESSDALDSLLLTLLQMTGTREPAGFSQALALVAGLDPRNTVQAMLAGQMAAVHLATMRAASNLGRTTEAGAVAMHTKALNNLARTFALQADTLKRLQGAGGQRVTVEHRHYNLAPGAVSGAGGVVLGDVAGGGARDEVER